MPGAGPDKRHSPVLQGQVSLADLAERVMPAVVNIAAVTTERHARPPLPQIPQLGPDTPFGDLFEEFFNRRGQGQQGQGQGQGPRVKAGAAAAGQLAVGRFRLRDRLRRASW